jgi:lipoprotein-anchoring transpeptidase ErfK/SrfK
VLFTQYFDRQGDALHLNYWRPESAFGAQPTSHGCVGMLLHDAQYLWLFAEPGMRVEIHD